MVLLIQIILSISAEDALSKVDKERLPGKYQSITIMRNHYEDGREISYRFDVTTEKGRATYLEILEPAREAGRKFLLVGSSIWMYAPEVGKSIRLSARDRFLGSEFSNSDLMESSFMKNYNAVDIDSTETQYLLKLEGKGPQSPYSKISMKIRKNNFIPSELEFYTLSGRLFRVMVMDSIRKFNGEPIATYLKMTNIITPDSYTEVEVKSIKTLKKIPSSLFKPENLKR